MILEGGTLVLSDDLLRELGVRDGDTVVLEVVQGELRVRSRDAVIAEIQALAREDVPGACASTRQPRRSRRGCLRR